MKIFAFLAVLLSIAIALATYGLAECVCLTLPGGVAFRGDATIHVTRDGALESSAHVFPVIEGGGKCTLIRRYFVTSSSQDFHGGLLLVGDGRAELFEQKDVGWWFRVGDWLAVSSSIVDGRAQAASTATFDGSPGRNHWTPRGTDHRAAELSGRYDFTFE